MQIPLLVKLAAQIKETGSTSEELTGDQLANIMKAVVDELLSGQDVAKIEVSSMRVEIANQQGLVNGKVEVQSPIKAIISINLTLGNGNQGLELVNLEIKEKAGFAAKMALKAVNIKGKVREALKDPNQALFEALKVQLQDQGVNLTKADLSFNQNTLSVNLQGN